MEQAVPSPSIHSLIPLDLSGRYARGGFTYQDHIAACLCMQMLEDDRISQVWFETEDDITIIWEARGIETVEFVQVKHEDRKSRWSVSALCAQKDGAKSIFEKSLANDRCKENVQFRVVTSYDVDQALDVLKLPIGGAFRVAELTKETQVITEIAKHLPNALSPNGNGIEFWVKNCWWEKYPDTIENLIAKNKICLEKILNTHPQHAFWDQRDELYQQLLGLVKDAATVPIAHDQALSKITRAALLLWFDVNLKKLHAPKGGTENLRRKLAEAGIDEPLIKRAEQLKWDYMKHKLDSDFVKGKQVQKLEADISSLLFDLKLQLDAGKLNLDGPNFLLKCKDEIEGKVPLPQNLQKDDAIAFMFDYTNRCLHRFIRPSK